ncbi:Cloroperoxidase [Trametes punicea]|nr:Cloroperoxidase [Trametes punicea]
MSPVSQTRSDHPYRPPTPGDSRSPCPGLNALANHGYLPRNGRDLTAAQLRHAIQEVYKISPALAYILARGGVRRCGIDGKLDLHNLALHNVLEHDGSLVHDNALKGQEFAPIEVDRALLQQLLDTSPKDYLTIHDFAQAQVTRQASSPPLKTLFEVTSLGEVNLILQVFGVRGSEGASHHFAVDEKHRNERVVPKRWLASFLGEERLPEGWPGPSKETGLLEQIGEMYAISNAKSKLVHDKRS